ncbi:MAG: hypothetical protein U0235_26475 [Polyangiaceae bacterium]
MPHSSARTSGALGMAAKVVLSASLVASIAACSSAGDSSPSAEDDSAALAAGCAAIDIAKAAERCDAAPPSVQPEGFRHEKYNDPPKHRARDMFYREGEPQYLLGKFAYGTLDDRMKDEDVDIFVLEGCGTNWKKLARVRTSKNDHSSMNVDGFEDDEGRLIYPLPPAQRLPVGRHRVRMVAVADGTATESFIEVVPKGTKLAVIDIDGTINLGMALEETFKVFDAASPVREGAPEVLQALAAKGYRPFYLTARADLDIGRTREFIRARGLPDGIVHTTQLLVGLFGLPAAVFKEGELDLQKNRGLVATFAFGNQKSDAEAYDYARVERSRRFFYGFDDAQYGGRRIDSYTDILTEIKAVPSTCSTH